jgi:hypothetical protein
LAVSESVTLIDYECIEARGLERRGVGNGHLEPDYNNTMAARRGASGKHYLARPIHGTESLPFSFPILTHRGRTDNEHIGAGREIAGADGLGRLPRAWDIPKQRIRM